jgi:hypothetical protein
LGRQDPLVVPEVWWKARDNSVALAHQDLVQKLSVLAIDVAEEPAEAVCLGNILL